MMKLVAAALFLPVASFSSPIINGGFETGDLTGWSALGNVTVVTSFSGIGPQAGTFQAALSTGAGSVSNLQAEVFLGLPPGALGLGNAQISVLKQQVNGSAGVLLNLFEDFLTNEAPTPISDAHALAEIVFVDAFGDSLRVSLASTECSGCLHPGTHGFSFETGYFTPYGSAYTIPFNPTTIGFVLADLGNDGVFHSTSLLLDSVAVSAPEPSTGCFVGFVCLAGVTCLLRLQQQNRPTVS
jgi:hypothetical protein